MALRKGPCFPSISKAELPNSQGRKTEEPFMHVGVLGRHLLLIHQLCSSLLSVFQQWFCLPIAPLLPYYLSFSCHSSSSLLSVCQQPLPIAVIRQRSERARQRSALLVHFFLPHTLNINQGKQNIGAANLPSIYRPCSFVLQWIRGRVLASVLQVIKLASSDWHSLTALLSSAILVRQRCSSFVRYKWLVRDLRRSSKRECNSLLQWCHSLPSLAIALACALLPNQQVWFLPHLSLRSRVPTEQQAVCALAINQRWISPYLQLL